MTPVLFAIGGLHVNPNWMSISVLRTNRVFLCCQQQTSNHWSIVPTQTLKATIKVSCQTQTLQANNWSIMPNKNSASNHWSIMPNTNSPSKTPLKHHAKHKLSEQNHWSIMPNTSSPSKTIEASCQTQTLRAKPLKHHAKHKLYKQPQFMKFEVLQAYNPKHYQIQNCNSKWFIFMKKYVLPPSK